MNKMKIMCKERQKSGCKWRRKTKEEGGGEGEERKKLERAE